MTSPEDFYGELLDGKIDRGHKKSLYARGGIPSYRIVDPLAERVTLTEYRLGPGGRYHEHLTSDGVVTLDRPWRVVLDLPEMTRRRDLIHTPERPYR